jgi:integrase
MLTGQRRDEVAGLRRSELKENGSLWIIPAARTKNGTEHDVPLCTEAQLIIRNLPQMGEEGYLFTTTGKTPISGYSNAKERLDAVMLELAKRDAELRGEAPDQVQIHPWRLHDLRRTVASGMARLGQPVHVIEAILNHRSGSISGVAAIYNRYNYLNEKRQALEAWSSFAEGLAVSTYNAQCSDYAPT